MGRDQSPIKRSSVENILVQKSFDQDAVKGSELPPISDLVNSSYTGNGMKNKEGNKHEIELSEYHTWANHIGGNLNTRNRSHKPHHTVKTTPYIEESLIMTHLKTNINSSSASINQSLPIKRRNSTGSIKVHRSVENMDVDNMIRVISIILHQHILNGSSMKWNIHPQYLIFDDSAMRFRSVLYEEIPSPEQAEIYIHRTAQLECDCIISSLLYIERLLTETAGKLRMCSKNWRSIILSGMILASKVWDDLSMWSIDFARVGHLTVKHINQLEVAVLDALGYNVGIDSSDFARYFFQLRHWCLLFEAAFNCAKDRKVREAAKKDLQNDSLSLIRGSRSESLPSSCNFSSMKKKFKRTLSSSQFASIYKGLFPCMEELVECDVTRAGGRKHCSKDLKQHELKNQLCYCLRKYWSNKSEREMITATTGNVKEWYETSPNRLLGVGVSGVVQVVRHKKSGEQYAMKVLQLDRLKNFQKKEELLNEIEVLSHLNHPNIVTLLEIYESPMKDSVNLIMELCTGGELLTRLHLNGSFSDEFAATITKKMLSAVYHCHSNRICHRDLKLENWVFKDDAPDAELKLIDFGLSRYFNENEFMTVPVGTPYTVAPEVLNCLYTCSCDLWSIGVQVFFMLTSVPPFYGEDDFLTLQLIKKGKWAWPHNAKISTEAKDFVEKLIVFDSTKRLTALQALQHPWILRTSGKRSTLLTHIKNLATMPLSKITLDAVVNIQEAR